MGCGKSCLVWTVIERLKSTTVPIAQHGPYLAYFYCDKTSTSTQTHLESVLPIARSLLKQLSASISPDMLPDRIVDIYERQNQAGSLTLEQCQELLTYIVDSNTDGCVLVMDGLDECPSSPIDVQTELVLYLQRLSKEAQTPVKIFWASRDEQHLRRLLMHTGLRSIDVPQHNGAELEKLVRAETEASAANPRLARLYRLPDEELQALAVSTLLKHAGGMFRWVQMSLAFLHASKTSFDLEDRLENLPRLDNLFDLYDKMWSTVMDDLSDRARAALMTALVITIYGNYSDLQVLSQAVGFAWKSDIDASMPLADIETLCPGFLIIKNVRGPELDEVVLSEDEEDIDSWERRNFDVPGYRAGPHSSCRTESTFERFSDEQAVTEPSYYVDPDDKEALHEPWERSSRDGSSLSPEAIGEEPESVMAIPHASVVEYLITAHSAIFGAPYAYIRLAILSIKTLKATTRLEPNPQLLARENRALVWFMGAHWVQFLLQAKHYGGSGMTMTEFLDLHMTLKSLVNYILSEAGQHTAIYVWQNYG